LVDLLDSVAKSDELIVVQPTSEVPARLASRREAHKDGTVVGRQNCASCVKPPEHGAGIGRVAEVRLV
jgi:hypothetical protein